MGGLFFMTVQKQTGGRKSLLEIYLDKNPTLRELILKTQKAPDSAISEYADIQTVDDLIEYACFELTRSKNENLLRGKTFCEYEKAFTHLFEVKEKLIEMQKDAAVQEKVALRNREEVGAFMKITLEAVASVIEDLPTRKKISDKIQELYDGYYPAHPQAGTNSHTGSGGQGTSQAAGPVVS